MASREKQIKMGFALKGGLCELTDDLQLFVAKLPEKDNLLTHKLLLSDPLSIAALAALTCPALHKPRTMPLPVAFIIPVD
jgi:hypothetical protein